MPPVVCAWRPGSPASGKDQSAASAPLTLKVPGWASPSPVWSSWAPEGDLWDTRVGGAACRIWVPGLVCGPARRPGVRQRRPPAYPPGWQARHCQVWTAGATHGRSTRIETTPLVPGWRSLMVGHFLKGMNRWKAVRTSIF